VRGVRHILNWDPDPRLTFAQRSDLMTDPAWLNGYAELARRSLSFDLQIYPWQLAGAAELAEKFPATPLILNHAGMPLHQRDMGLETWRIGMRQLAHHPNASVKISGLGMVDWHWSAHSIRPLVLETIDIFGPERCMFASNFPVDRLYSSFDTLYAAFEEIVVQFSEAEQYAMFAGNARRIYRF
jgi:predicted TIM-barrel fold metal-dependent hydrolase